MKSRFYIPFFALLCCHIAQGQERKPYVDAPWLSERENKIYANNYFTSGSWVYIGMRGLSFSEGDWGALHNFAVGVKRYKQATRFLAVWDTLMPEYQEFDRWVYDRDQETVFPQSSPDGKTGWRASRSIEIVGVTDEMITRAAKDENNTIFDLWRFGATLHQIGRNGRLFTIPKSDPRVIARRNEFLNKEAEKESKPAEIKS